MSVPVILQSEPDVDLLHTLEIEPTDDPDQALLTERFEDCAGAHYQHIWLPIEKIPAVCEALMRHWREAQH